MQPGFAAFWIGNGDAPARTGMSVLAYDIFLLNPQTNEVTMHPVDGLQTKSNFLFPIDALPDPLQDAPWDQLKERMQDAVKKRFPRSDVQLVAFMDKNGRMTVCDPEVTGKLANMLHLVPMAQVAKYFPNHRPLTKPKLAYTNPALVRAPGA